MTRYFVGIPFSQLPVIKPVIIRRSITVTESALETMRALLKKKLRYRPLAAESTSFALFLTISKRLLLLDARSPAPCRSAVLIGFQLIERPTGPL